MNIKKDFYFDTRRRVGVFSYSCTINGAVFSVRREFPDPYSYDAAARGISLPHEWDGMRRDLMRSIEKHLFGDSQ